MNIDNEIDKKFAELDAKTRKDIRNLCYEIVDSMMNGVEQLTNEELNIIKGRSGEKAKRLELLDQATVAMTSGDGELASDILHKAARVGGDFCEHGRSVFSSCIACDELAQKFGVFDEEE